MSTTEIIIVIFSVLATITTIWVTAWFVRRKNRPKVSRTEDRKAELEKPRSGEIEDPLN